MPNENISLKIVTPDGDSNTTHDMIIGKSYTFQRSLLIVTSSLLALLVLVAVAGTSGGQHLQTSTYEIVEGAVALVDYQVDSANSALTNNIFDLGVVSKNDEGCNLGPCGRCMGLGPCGRCVGTCRIRDKSSGGITTQYCSTWDKGYCVCKGCCDLCHGSISCLCNL